MTPKEKAHELINKYCGYSHTSHIHKAAIVCVDEIIKSWNEDGNKRLDAPVIDYWEKVKKEIELHKKK